MLQRPDASRLARNGFKGIAAALQQRVEDGRLPIGRFLPTERELQEEFGASRSTIRRAIALLVDKGYAQSVPSKGVVASPGSGPFKTRNIALIDGSTYVLRVLVVRISELLRARGYHLVHLGGNDEKSIEESLEYAAEQDFAGALVWPYRGFPDQQRIAELAKRVPLVALSHRIRGVTTDLVTFDNLAAGALAAAHLIRQGCRRVGVSGMMDMLDITHARFSGYMWALFDHGLCPNVLDYQFTFTSGMKAPDVAALEARLKDPDGPDGLVVLQDEFMPATVEAVLHAGFRVPEDLKLIAIGDDLDVTIGDRGMTSIALDWEVLAQTAIELLLGRLEDPSRPAQVRLAPHRLVVRGLCGAPESEWTPNPEQHTGFHGQLPHPRSRYQFASSSNYQNELNSNHDPSPAGAGSGSFSLRRL